MAWSLQQSSQAPNLLQPSGAKVAAAVNDEDDLPPLLRMSADEFLEHVKKGMPAKATAQSAADARGEMAHLATATSSSSTPNGHQQGEHTTISRAPGAQRVSAEAQVVQNPEVMCSGSSPIAGARASPTRFRVVGWSPVSVDAKSRPSFNVNVVRSPSPAARRSSSPMRGQGGSAPSSAAGSPSPGPAETYLSWHALRGNPVVQQYAQQRAGVGTQFAVPHGTLLPSNGTAAPAPVQSPQNGQLAQADASQHLQHLLGTWRYAETSKYHISRTLGNVQFDETHKSGRAVRAMLEPCGEWMQGELHFVGTDEPAGFMRLRLTSAALGSMLSNYRGSGETEWGEDLLAHREAGAAQRSGSPLMRTAPLAFSSSLGGCSQQPSQNTQAVQVAPGAGFASLIQLPGAGACSTEGSVVSAAAAALQRHPIAAGHGCASPVAPPVDWESRAKQAEAAAQAARAAADAAASAAEAAEQAARRARLEAISAAS